MQIFSILKDILILWVLFMTFENIKDEKIRTLASTLRCSGMASSDSEALRMAQEMSATADKVQRSYDKQESGTLESLDPDAIVERVAKEPVEAEPASAEPAPESFNRNINEDVLKSQEALIKSSYSGMDSEKTVAELMDEDASRIYAESAKEEIQEVSVESEPEFEAQSTYEESELDSKSDLDDAADQLESYSVSETESVDDGYEVDETVEIESEKKSEEEREEEAEKMAESKIDLSDVFNFGKR